MAKKCGQHHEWMNVLKVNTATYVKLEDALAHELALVGRTRGTFHDNALQESTCTVQLHKHLPSHVEVASHELFGGFRAFAQGIHDNAPKVNAFAVPKRCTSQNLLRNNTCLCRLQVLNIILRLITCWWGGGIE